MHFQLTAGTSVRNAAVVRDRRHRSVVEVKHGSSFERVTTVRSVLDGEHVLTLLAVRAGLVEP